MADTRHVDTARGDVGRDEQLDVARTESLKRMGALRLALVAMDRHRLDAGAREVAHDAVGAMLGAGEDQRAIDIFAGDDRVEPRLLFLLFDESRILDRKSTRLNSS